MDEFTEDREELPECRPIPSTPPTIPRLELEMESLVESRKVNSVGRCCCCWRAEEPLGCIVALYDDEAAGTLIPLPTLPWRSELTELVSPPVDMVIWNRVKL